MEQDQSTILKLIDVNKVFHTGEEDVIALKDIHLELYRNEIVSITGESGSGKSTLLNLVGGLDNPTRGVIWVDGLQIENLPENKLSLFRSQSIGFIFQSHYLLPDFTALENVMLPYLANNYNRKEASKRATRLLSEVGLKDRLKHKPSQLSGGERQRVAVARALINNPKILLADEPTGNLDRENTKEVWKLLWDLGRTHQLTVIVVSHNLEIWRSADRKFLLTYGEMYEEKE